MKYKATILPGGKFETVVLDPGKHVCNEIVQVIGSFGEIKKVEDKKDDVPVRTDIHVGGRHV
jgi:hypothetical protein